MRDAADRTGAVLIYDEVVTGLRLGRGGAAKWFGVSPDLTCLGKAIGGGLPIAAFGGRVDLMEGALGLGAAATGHRVFQSGTFSANPLSLAAGRVVLDRVAAEDPSPRLDRSAARLRAGLDAALAAHGVAARTTGSASIFQLHFASEEPRHRRDILAADIPTLHAFLLGLMAEGVFWTPIHPGLTCVAHTEDEIDGAIAAANRCARRDGRGMTGGRHDDRPLPR